MLELVEACIQSLFKGNTRAYATKPLKYIIQLFVFLLVISSCKKNSEVKSQLGTTSQKTQKELQTFALKEFEGI